MNKEIKQQLNELIILMYQEQANNDPRITRKLSNYIKTFDKYKEYQIIKYLIDNGLTNWKIRKGAYDDVVITPDMPNLTEKGIKIAEFLLKPNWQKFLIRTRNIKHKY